MPALREADQVGKRQELADYITNIEAQTTPFVSMVRKGSKPKQTLIEFQMEAYATRGHKGVLDGLDVDSHDHTPRQKAQAYPQKMWFNPSVTDFADETEVAGLGQREMAHQKALGLVTLKRSLESRASSNAEQQADDGVTEGYETRGALRWVGASAQSVLPVHADFQTPTGSKHLTALVNLTEDAFGDLLQSMFEQRLGLVKVKGLVGVALKRHISRYTTYVDDSASQTPVRAMNQDAKSKAIINSIDKLVTDCGEVDLIPTTFLARDEDTGEATDFTARSGLLMDPKMWELRYTRLPRMRDLEDRGGGPRAIIDLIAAVLCKNPKGEGLIYTDSDS